jgi:hypothetical protein
MWDDKKVEFYVPTHALAEEIVGARLKVTSCAR